MKDDEDGFNESTVDHEKFEEMLSFAKIDPKAKKRLVREMKFKINDKLSSGGGMVNVSRSYNHSKV